MLLVASGTIRSHDCHLLQEDRGMTELPKDMFSDGAAYERLMGQWSRKAGIKFLDWWSPQAGLTWLDVGCGNGAFTEEILAHTKPASVIGIDPAPGQIEYASKRAGTSSASFQVGDAMALPFADGSFDVATMALVISFVPEPPKAVSELKRVVRNGGQAAIYMWDLPGMGVPLSPFYKALQAMDLPAANPPQPHASRIEVMDAMWREAGFTDVETTVIKIEVVHPSFDVFWSSNTSGVGPHAKRLASLSPVQLEELKSRVREIVQPGADGSVRYEAFANAVKGRA
jgi:SAM-dependent methyltransferase